MKNKTINTRSFGLSFLIMLNLFCWNCRGIMSSAFSLSEFLDNNDIDIALISEHKLFPKSATFLESINRQYAAYATFDTRLNQYGPLRCGRAGTAVLFKKTLNGRISRLPIESERILGVEVHRKTSCLYTYSALTSQLART